MSFEPRDYLRHILVEADYLIAHSVGLRRLTSRERITSMESSTLSQLLRLPAGDRAELAMALWESLSDADREGELAITEEQGAELDRRWAEHLADPASAVPWSEVRRKLMGLG